MGWLRLLWWVFVATIGLTCLVAAALVILWSITHGLRNRGRGELQLRFAAADVLVSDTLAESYGRASLGPNQARGNGVLAVTREQLFFMLYTPTRRLEIPLADVREVSLVRSHLGKASDTDLLLVRFAVAAGEDAIAWRTHDPGAWKLRLDQLLQARAV